MYKLSNKEDSFRNILSEYNRDRRTTVSSFSDSPPGVLMTLSRYINSVYRIYGQVVAENTKLCSVVLYRDDWHAFKSTW